MSNGNHETENDGIGTEGDMNEDEIIRSEGVHERNGSAEIDRSDVGVRIVYTLLFAIVLSVLESLIFVVVTYQLLYSLVMQRLPGERVQGFANGLVAYFRQILRYITHNDSVMPFPFSDFPEPLEPTRDAYADSAQEHARHATP